MLTDQLSELLTPYRPGAEWTVAAMNTLAALALLLFTFRLPRRLNGAAAPDLNATDDSPSTDGESDHRIWIKCASIAAAAILVGALLRIGLPTDTAVLMFSTAMTILMTALTILFLCQARILHECNEAGRNVLAVFAGAPFFFSMIGWSNYEMEGRLVALLVPATTLGFALWLARLMKSKFVMGAGLLIVSVELYEVLRSPPVWRLRSDFFSPQATSSFVLLHVTTIAVMTITLLRASTSGHATDSAPPHPAIHA